jgi:hypothetical protein
MAQGTKVNPWEFVVVKEDITSLVVPNNRHLAFFVDLILTLRWDPPDESVFLHTLKLGLITCTT